jgi:flavin reductase (DIM6/NTAB) family NADH-FMN oxidoreductase RutF
VTNDRTEPMTTFMVEELSSVDRYKLTTGLIVPRPIGWIGTYGPDRTPNLAPYSFFQAVATNPPVVLFSTGVIGGVSKDSLDNCRTSGVFTANLVDHDLSVAMNATAATVTADVDEFELAGLTPANFGTVDAPGVVGAKAVLECRVVREVEFGDDPAMNHVVTFGEVVAFHIADAVLDGTRIDAEALDAVGRLSGMAYATTRDSFTLDRPD